MDTETAGNLRHVVLPVSHERAGHREVTRRELRLAPSDAPTAACSPEPCPRALLNQVALKLRQGGEDVKDEPTGWRVRLDALREGHEPYPPPLQVAHDPHQISERAAKAIKSPDHQDIPRAECLQAAFELGPGGRLAGSMLLVDERAAVATEGIELEIQVLVIRGNAGVSDKHRRRG